MIAPRILPCLDVHAGRVVKGVRFQSLRDAGDPVELARLHESEGADELVLLDVSAGPEGRGHALATVRAVRASLGIPLTVGGGVRAVADAEAMFQAGADRVALGSAAVRTPELCGALAALFGSQAVVLSLDAAAREPARPGSGWIVVIDSGRTRTDLDAVEWAARAEELGVGEILLTSWDRDGTRTGYDLELVRAVSARVRIPVIASGGADGVDDLDAALAAGASAVLAASILHGRETSVSALKRALAARGWEMRP